MKLYKYTLGLHARESILLTEGAEVLTVQLQGGGPVFWALVDLTVPAKEVVVLTFPTGADVDPVKVGKYLGTVQLPWNGLVYHFFLEKTQ